MQLWVFAALNISERINYKYKHLNMCNSTFFIKNIILLLFLELNFIPPPLINAYNLISKVGIIEKMIAEVFKVNVTINFKKKKSIMI